MLSWTKKTSGIIAPEERLPWPSTITLGLQHTLAMFGSTVVAPLLMGFPVNTAIFFSGIATILFFLIVGGKVPSYLGSSVAFIGPVIAAMGGKAGANLPVALGGIVAAGVVYLLLAIITILVGTRWIEVLMPPAVTGAIVMVIGLNLANVGAGDIGTSQANLIIAGVTLDVALLSAIYLPGMLRRLPILLGGVTGYVVAVLMGLGHVAGAPAISFAGVAKAAWIGLPTFTSPHFDGRAISLIAPVAIVLVAENTGHIKAVGQITRTNLDGYLGRGFLGDALSTIIAVFLIASVVALLLGLCPKFGALVQTIPDQAPGILGGLSIVLFGLIAATGARIWVENGVNFGKGCNLLMAGITLILGTGSYSITLGSFQLSGIALATLAALLSYQILRDRDDAEPDTIEPATTPATPVAEPVR